MRTNELFLNILVYYILIKVNIRSGSTEYVVTFALEYLIKVTHKKMNDKNYEIKNMSLINER